tara:strand:+ start:664 stop:1194 length:531 start_codon:yes stop_codon:yes gene_type:complete
MNLIKKLCWGFAAILALGPMAGCALFDKHERDDDGYYRAHYWACGPKALEKAINAAYAQREIKSVKNPVRRKKISQQIQDGGMLRKEALSFFNKDAIQITWPAEVKKIANQYGFEVVPIKNLESLDPKKDIAIVLIHGKFFTEQYHWVVYPLDNIKNFYGKKTVIDMIYLLKWKGN